jgi:HEAT repeat protein
MEGSRRSVIGSWLPIRPDDCAQEKALLELLANEDVAGRAVVVVLPKLKLQHAVQPLEVMLQHSKTWVRKEAAKSLKRIAAAPS